MVFQGDDQPLAELSKALKQAADTLSGAHFGFRMEFAGGRSPSPQVLGVGAKSARPSANSVLQGNFEDGQQLA